MATSLASAPPSLATAAAADLASIYYAAPVRSVAFNWAGAYVGATFGYEWSSVDNNPTNPNGVAGGFEAGFNRQNGSPVYGGETGLGFSATANMFAPWQFSNPWFGTARGRASFAGLAYGDVTGSTPGNPPEGRSNLGWAAGLGAEPSFTQHWSVKAEWLYFDLDDRHFSATAANNSLAANLVHLGLNYRF